MKKPIPIHTWLKKLCERYHIEIMYAFGSRSQEIKAFVDGKGPLHPEVHSSDVDMGIKLSEACHLPVREKVRLTLELEDLFDVVRVDLVVLSESDPFLAVNIVRGERLYCADDYLADEYELYLLRRAGDLAHLERERLRIIFREQD